MEKFKFKEKLKNKKSKTKKTSLLFKKVLFKKDYYFKLFFNSLKLNVTLVSSIPLQYSKLLLVIVKKTHFFTFKYPKMILFLFCVLIASLLLNNSEFIYLTQHQGALNYLGIFIAGLLFSFGFTTPFAVAILIGMRPENILLFAIIGGIGATISDILIFKFVKFSFEKEFLELKKERPFLFVKEQFSKNLHPTILTYISFAFGGFLLSSPLPDEAGILILSGVMEINVKLLIILSLIFKTIGIFLLLLI